MATSSAHPHTHTHPPQHPHLQLPDELLMQILDFIADDVLLTTTHSDDDHDNEHDHDSLASTSLSTLHAVARSGRRLHSIATPLLYRCAVLLDLSFTVAVDPTLLCHAEHDLDLNLSSYTPRRRRHLDSRFPLLLSACELGNDRLVESLARAAAAISNPRPNSKSDMKASSAPSTCSPSACQAYLAASFYKASHCPLRHWPALFPEHKRDELECRYGHRQGDGLGEDKTKKNTNTDSVGQEPAMATPLPLSYSTALHAASQHGHVTTVQLLLELLAGDRGRDGRDGPDSNRRGGRTHGDDDEARYIQPPLPPLFTGIVMATAGPPLAAALDAPARMSCLCHSRHLHASSRSDFGLGDVSGIISRPHPVEWPLATPLMLAIASGNAEVAKVLIASGATWALPAIPEPWQACGGVTALQMIAANCMVDLAEWLVWWCKERGAHGCDSSKEGGRTLPPPPPELPDYRSDFNHPPRTPPPPPPPPPISWRSSSPDAITMIDWPDQEGHFAIHYAALCQLPSPVATSSEAAVPPPTRMEMRRLVRALVNLGGSPAGLTTRAKVHVNRALIREHRGRVQRLQESKDSSPDAAAAITTASTKNNNNDNNKNSTTTMTAGPLPARLLPSPSCVRSPNRISSIWFSPEQAVLRRYQIRYWAPLTLLRQEQYGHGHIQRQAEADDGEVAGRGDAVGDVEVAFCYWYLDMLEAGLDCFVEQLDEAAADERDSSDGEVSPVALALAHGNADLVAELELCGY
ncbi:hypothetical protein VMCG_10720 [Cytospora schulzeri]|uniref:Uncharacterized protein n=1 Tax=Cytospora schulzeri TaxID=448051 RepID=A0A423V8X4_9PEZI|nr:hypothetical protein VMCG_10720 [Valsa malicola]